MLPTCDNSQNPTTLVVGICQDKCCNRLKETFGEGFFEFFNKSDCEGEMNKDACKDFLEAMKDKDLNEIKWDHRRRQVENMLKMMQIVVDSPKEDAVFKWWRNAF